MSADSMVPVDTDEYYCGRILKGPFSTSLKKRVAECMQAYRLFEQAGNPAIPYISAWHAESMEIWYEYTDTRFCELLGCESSELAQCLRTSIQDRKIYKIQDLETGVQKEVLSREELTEARSQLRRETMRTGIIEAVYQIAPPGESTIWLKDQATIEVFEKDRIYLSLGNLTIVSKEMAAEEKCERLIVGLRAALSQVKTLSGLLPICSSCKKIRDDKGYWKQIEVYIQTHSEAEFSHGVCPSCARKLYPELYKDKKPNGSEIDHLTDEIADLDAFLDKL